MRSSNSVLIGREIFEPVHERGHALEGRVVEVGAASFKLLPDSVPD